MRRVATLRAWYRPRAPGSSPGATNRAALLIGRTTSDMVRNILVISLMCGVGFAVGFELHTNVVALIAALGLLLAFAYALSWMFVLVGLFTKNAETAQALSFPIMAVLVFASGCFVPVASMPGWLQVFARNQPVAQVVYALRSLVLGGPTATHVAIAAVWIAGITAVSAPLAATRYSSR